MLPPKVIFNKIEKITQFFTIKIVASIAITVSFIVILLLFLLQRQLMVGYNNLESSIITDRNGNIITIQPNGNGNYARYINTLPENFKKILIKKEDKLFYYHFGFNPVSILKASLGKIGIGGRRASSTISQQLAKILLSNESKRNITNKFIELFYALSLEIFNDKETILRMYANAINFGNQTQGIYEASQLYFNTSPEFLNDGQALQLSSSISSPTFNNPLKAGNVRLAKSLADKLKIPNNQKSAYIDFLQVRNAAKQYNHTNQVYFELPRFLNEQQNKETYKKCRLTIDVNLTQKIRKIVSDSLDSLKIKSAKNAAVIAIALPENEVLTLIGSPNPSLPEDGYKINMLNVPRAIGSTIKPFIYLKAFEKGIRPYTLIDDREYKYTTVLGFPLYPKNFDYQYHGEVNAHYALSNSLNVPAVKVLEFVGLEEFSSFLLDDLGFSPVQDLNKYQLGIALGALEMNLIDLSKYFTLFPNEGILKELQIIKDGDCQKSQEKQIKRISEEKYIQLINKILSDRQTSSDQFGFKSELNLFQKNYALKTGTSVDFRDSWVIGYTPDFLVGVWVGNADNTPTHKVSGQIGAGVIWSQIMELILNSQYNKKTEFEFSEISSFENNGMTNYGFADDNYEKILNLLKNNNLIIQPHDDDKFALEKNTQIVLRAQEIVFWSINGIFMASGKETIFAPKAAGIYKIEAKTQDKKETIIISVLPD